MESGKHQHDARKKVENRNTPNKYSVKHPNANTIHHSQEKSADAKSSKTTQLKSAIKEHGSVQHKSSKHKPATLYQQQFLRIDSSTNSETFSVMSYNILANCNISKQYFPYCRRHELDWKERVPKILKRIHRFSADVLCLQEVEDFSQLELELDKQNYAGIYKQRTGANRDGCAIFYHKKKFELLDHTLVEYNQSHQIEWLDRDNVAIVCMLKLIGNHQPSNNNENNNQHTERFVCVANTHLLFNPKRGDIKFAQLQLLFMTIKSMLDHYSDLSPALVVCGDLNLTPGSYLFDCIRRGVGNLQKMNPRTASGQLTQNHKNDSDSDPMEAESTSNPHKLHDFPLKSAYQQYYEDEPIVTSYHSTFTGTVDYVWYNSDTLHLHQLLSVPTIPEVNSGLLGRGLPNIVQPSDHLPLLAKFAFPVE